MLKPLAICGKIQKIYMKNASIICNKSRIITNFGKKVAHRKPIPHAKEHSEIFTDVRDNDVIMLKFEHFVEKHSTLKGVFR